MPLLSLNAVIIYSFCVFVATYIHFYLFRFYPWHVCVICNDGLSNFRGSAGKSFTYIKECTLIVIM
jgi:hypothetical protein